MDAYKRIRHHNTSRLSDDSLLSNRDLSVAEIGRRFSNHDIGATVLPVISSSNFIRRMAKKVLNSYLAGALLTAFTLFALFGDDVRMLAFALKHDNYFFSASALCLGVFLFDLVLSTWLRPGYFWSFYFFLDILSTISLIPDIGWIWDIFIDSSNSESEATLNQIQNAGKASRAGARSSKIVRILRLLRLIRLVKLYNNARLPRAVTSLQVIAADPLSIPEESKIGKKMSELTTKRVITVVLLLLISLPIMDLTFMATNKRSWDYGGHLMDQYINSEAYTAVMQRFLVYHQRDTRPIIFFSLQLDGNAFVWRSDTSPSDLRIIEKYYATSDFTVAIFDIRSDTRLEALLSICKTIFVCTVFALGAVYLTKAANDLVIIPIEKMMNKVKRIAKNPLAAQVDKMKDVYDVDEKIGKRCCEHTSSRELETLILENSILKISALLALSFGEAGSSIIAENLKKTGELDSMLAGKKTSAIFGFCDIRNFTDTTEVLQEDVMIFVNEIAEIVHHIVDAHLGAANKNIGDAFLVVWRVDPDQTNPNYMENLADLSLISFLKILADLNRSRKLQRYRSHAGLLRRMPKYTVRLGCGLHFGWAIEGSIGSDMKIDASYLSPHVNIVAQLEETTKTYGVPILISNALFEIMSPDTRVRCRHIDTVLLRGAKVKLYTFDVDFTLTSKGKFKSYNKVRSKRKRASLLRNLQDRDFSTSTLFQKSKTLVRVRSLVDPSFIHNFGEAVAAYETGEWKRAQTLLIQGLSTMPNDQPTRVLLDFMESYNFTPPETWSGFRELPSFV